ncbi:hypothetical protein OQ968_20825 [Mycobacterium sp. 663a-19]|uniref:hypothetical protein n=1 Tax=Mycobacterium sp. 663a-19 TaxID=2986148 RepID=UPI002D1F2C16|nr:hypothetical protein [Mycobacterium sp. 663a-19]MEB3983699.1 hypothetical protein [Mycobacterium sp. 663a-19]
MNDIVLPYDAPEADAIHQRLVVDAEDEIGGLDTTHVEALGDRDANEADVIDQAIVVPVPRHDRP